MRFAPMLRCGGDGTDERRHRQNEVSGGECDPPLWYRRPERRVESSERPHEERYQDQSS